MSFLRLSYVPQGPDYGYGTLTLATGDQSDSGRAVKLISAGSQEVSEAWFQPDYWGDRATPVASGGRGGAWFIDAEPDSLVLRHYRRGGMMARLAEKTYLFTGFDQTRSIAELRLMEKLRSLGLPVPEAVAAIAWRHQLLWYQAAILVKRIPGAVTFCNSEDLSDEWLWRQLGEVIRRFHDKGLNHVDLNCDNILIADSRIYLIDFDRCKLMPESSHGASSGWKRRNLDRLYRSICKRCPDLEITQRETLWQNFTHAYQSRS